MAAAAAATAPAARRAAACLWPLPSAALPRGGRRAAAAVVTGTSRFPAATDSGTAAGTHTGDPSPPLSPRPRRALRAAIRYLAGSTAAGAPQLQIRWHRAPSFEGGRGGGRHERRPRGSRATQVPAAAAAAVVAAATPGSRRTPPPPPAPPRRHSPHSPPCSVAGIRWWWRRRRRRRRRRPRRRRQRRRRRRRLFLVAAAATGDAAAGQPPILCGVGAADVHARSVSSGSLIASEGGWGWPPEWRRALFRRDGRLGRCSRGKDGEKSQATVEKEKQRPLARCAVGWTLGLCITPLFGWRGGRCTPNHALLHAPNVGTPLSRP